MRSYNQKEKALYKAITEEIAIRVQRQMIKKGIKRKDLEIATGLGQGHLCYFILGYRPISIEGLRRIALALDVPLKKLLPE